MPVVENLLESIGHFLIKKAQQSRKRKSLRKKSPKKTVRKKSSTRSRAPRKKAASAKKKKAVSRKKLPVKKAVKARPAPRKKISTKNVRKKKVSRKKVPVRKKAKARKPAAKLLRKKAPVRPAGQSGMSAGKPAGEITHFFDRISVCVVRTAAPVKVGDRIRVLGKNTDFAQTIQSMQVESVDVKSARKGQLVGLKTVRPARVGDKIYRL